MSLGAFSISLAVKNIQKSLSFYEALGFEAFHGDIDQGWLILDNGNTKIGLFQGMFDKNIMTFNPGWDANAQPVDVFKDVRDIQKCLKEQGIEIMNEADETTTGPASFTVIDPDGNPVLIDQHV
ncbi:catechol 2,3-dioxygenase-like lactoylglutathione lyase family enzyme [Litorimonas taeanensis]|uniref:Catechol 2,3-dioxygenase-like lactoylglutathione lyase family enzyme n=1 Tax=Litorimonas taeanensis TaxID=568099 RepID=A0A420WEU7_9PROT|nr:VOC family protein [Litorimonas taeanensis]RKQ69499.1 catechol 2,3-dioxygenase-like lactoylglutathione lyase family enzyme [Litorimonas taeanensis]